MENQEPKIEGEEHTIQDVYDKHARIAELLEKAKTIPDSHWKDIDEVTKALQEVENYLEANIGSED